MGRVVNVTDSVYATSAVGLTYSVLIGSNIENDVVVVHISTGETSALGAAPANWTQLGTQNASQGCRSAWYYRVAPAGGFTGPVTFTVPNGHTMATCIVLRGVALVAGVPTFEWQRYDWGNSTNIATAASTSVTASSEAANAMITPPDKALLLYSFVSDGGPYLRASQNELMMLSFIDGQSSGVSQAVGYRQHSTGTLPVVNFYASLATEGGNMWVLSFADDGTGILDRQWLSGGDEFFYAGDYGEVLFPFGTTTNAATTIDDAQASPPATPTLGGYDLSSTAATYYAAATFLNSSNGLGTRFRTVLASTPTVWQGLVQTLNSNKNMENKIFAMHYVATINSVTPLGSDGMAIAFADAEGDWTAYQLSTEAALLADAERVCFISLGYGTELGSGIAGTMNWADIDKIGYLIQRTKNDTTNIDLTVKNLMLLGTAKITGGYAAIPATFQWSVTPAGSWSIYDTQRLQGSGQSLVNWPLQIGDGTAATYFNATASAYTTPSEYSVASATSQQDWNVPAGRAGITVYAADGDTMDFSASLLNNSILQPFTIHASSSTDVSTTYNFQGCTFVGWTVTWKTGVECDGATFSNCDTVNFKGADPVNVTIKSPHSDVGATDAACSFDDNAGSMTTSTIDITGSSAGYFIKLESGVTAITLNGVTLTGTPNNAGADKIYSELASGTLTITTDGTGTSLVAGDVTFVGGSTAVAVIAAPQVYQKVTVSGITTGARVQIYDTTSSTELFNGTATAGDTVVSGSTVVWTDPAAASADRAIRVRVSYVSGATAKNFIETSGLTCGQTAGTAEITYPVSPTDDTVYNANGENGSTIYGAGEISFVDASPDRIEMNMTADTISLKEQYAAWVYYVFTSAGIASDIDYINAIDTANYEYTGIRWKNTSSPTAPLKITGGYAWDSSTLDPMTLIDTSGGTIFLAPAHVVAYQTSGTYAITGDISTVLAAIPSDTDNAAAVLAAAVDGSTTVAESIRLHNAVLGGKVSGAGSGTETFRDLADTKDRVVATVDTDGNRTAITRDLT